MQLPVLLVFSHRRWNSPELRLQHLLSRLAGRWQVLFVEEPQAAEGVPRLEAFDAAPELTVLTPHTDARGFQADRPDALQRLLRQYIETRHLHVDIAWLSTPMVLPLARSLGADCLVYDCVEEREAADGMPQRYRHEDALMQQAALVLTAGPLAHGLRRHLHNNVHCLPDAVDMRHFSPVQLKHGSTMAKRAHELQSHLPRARLGFAGTIDRRLDLDLIAAIAEQHPRWSIIMAGPVVGLDPAQLPKQPNIHWLGPQPYEQLPYLLAGWDAALLPFVLDESTRFLNPPQTLQYMAAGLPVISTAIRDVQALYFPAVTMTSTDRFVEACEEVLSEGTLARCARLVEMTRRASRNSWDDMAGAVHLLLEDALLGVSETLPDDVIGPRVEALDWPRTAHRVVARA